MGSRSVSPPREADWMKLLARVGYGAKGVVYLIIGILAIRGVDATGPQDALSTIGQQPFGKILLGLVTLGLLAYASWRWVQSLADPEDEGDGAKAIGKRVGYFVSGVVYAGLAVSAAELILGGGGSGANGAESWTARVLALTFGQWLVGLAGTGVILGGLHQLKQAVTADFTKNFALNEMDAAQKIWAERIGRVGHAARTVVYLIIGWFLIEAAVTSNAGQAGGISEALDTLQAQPYGPWLLGAAGTGLICYGVYCFVMARYRKAVT